MKKEINDSFKSLIVGFKWGPLNFDFALTYSHKFNQLIGWFL